ncbi:alpha/beta fold hydrolase domain-containing protein [Sandaracinobacteroides saxicola]|uniref:Alpha/beta fold hydrolase n=1 Tax=Sandaracinobacteroides saxicola TaxID=2759707 RepID=A0A7G5ILF2_9SPHN|nr:alpha/beta fold hydrolase [Sandaracinobacteroides saxicola]QMW24194.1 alpha/beta fold hydrolase [Sandaracinobacteroides saxicola]
MPHSYSRTPILILFEEKQLFKETYGGEIDRVALSAHWLKPDRPSDTVVVFMHPVGGQMYLPMINAFARAGTHVIVSDSRYRADHALIMEKVVLDLAAVVREARGRLGYRHVILGGWSGGGSLSLTFQAEAEAPTITATPAGDPPSLVDAGLVPADAVMLLAAHRARHLTLTEWMDPSIIDEADPDRRDPALDLYGPEAPTPPYDTDFLARYRAAQVARNQRITVWVKERLARLRAAGRGGEEHAFTVHGTMADPRWLDPSIDPNGRKPNWCYLGDPRIVNNGPVGLARFTTLRSWLSQWSYDDARGDGLAAAARISVPVLLISNGADDACTPDQAESLFAAIRHDDRELHVIDGANHYYFGQPDKVAEAVALCQDWMRRHGFDA